MRDEQLLSNISPNQAIFICKTEVDRLAIRIVKAINEERIAGGKKTKPK